VVLHSQLAEEEGRFSLADVAAEVNAKLVRRHPHVFGDVAVSGSSEVLRNWEQIKRAEKGARRQSVLDGIPPTLPALSLAQTIGRKAAKVGFDWPDVEGTFAKVREELDEIHEARDAAERRDEMGDLLYALTSVCRHLEIDAEDALRAATRKFAARFRRVESYARERSLTLTDLPIEALDALWEEAKADTSH
jgi:tetrapyrrole methylase family protein/MazG family protein